MNILIIDDEELICQSLKDILEDEKHTVFTAVNGTAGLEYFNREKISIVFLDVWMPDMGGIEVLKKIKEQYKEVEVVMISGHAKVDQAVKATRLGAYDFIEKPLTLDKVIGVVKSIERHQIKGRNEPVQTISNEMMIGNSLPMQTIKFLIENSSKSDARILILGENGTGKELVAREVHLKSYRAQKPFIGINCAAIPENLIESELFGHIKGSFTGASADKAGKFELAHLGTLFLDEVADMSLPTQAKVLRVLQEMKLNRIGSAEEIPVDVRIISATNKDIKEEIKKGNFREDLYYRLNVIPIYLPPLRERKDDIESLIAHFMKQLGKDNRMEEKKIDDQALEYLRNYYWPGNIRQLRNIIERLLIMVAEPVIHLDDIKRHLDHENDFGETQDHLAKYNDFKLNIAVDEFEKEFIEKKLKENQYNISKTAKVLGVYPSNLHSKINKLGIVIEDKK